MPGSDKAWPAPTDQVQPRGGPVARQSGGGGRQADVQPSLHNVGDVGDARQIAQQLAIHIGNHYGNSGFPAGQRRGPSSAGGSPSGTSGPAEAGAFSQAAQARAARLGLSRVIATEQAAVIGGDQVVAFVGQDGAETAPTGRGKRSPRRRRWAGVEDFRPGPQKHAAQHQMANHGGMGLHRPASPPSCRRTPSSRQCPDRCGSARYRRSGARWCSPGNAGVGCDLQPR